ncbi:MULTISPECIES: 50S ribosomal protein L1 [unclassified Oceanispirochaeta]|uniref:50S ribosomal protein L1 n=1 Tax=unclassified Oceanispirochaeta TaxID=2635722 RepID=UPI000E09A3E4|nr:MULTISPECIES: 50S ribosomal protein L1 [unclassified Oceanispirochaeta]MBF9017120.1 50S ribosomal protein L1 [Oceanispirochaeta sp. M2]NPD73569.1 50S ribosomal protein L1 [Oceanispirochaeta sp. M1]RDG30673.1 50S ribosomal protein L1 [Oceanispirochaeta sp. M1]
MAKGKNYIAAAAKVDFGKVYETTEAVSLVKEAAFAKFDETVEVSVKLNIKKNHSIRDTVSLPNQFTAEKKILVFAKGDKAKEALEAGAAYVGDEDLVAKIKDGWLDFDVCVATPDMMREVGKLGPVLGRRGLMPNPKTRTVTMDIKGALAELKQGRVEYRADKTGVVHLAVGKVSMDASSIAENYDVFMSDLIKKRPSDVKGEFIKSIALSSTMGPGVKVVVKE